jgi:hypothetical protein
VDYSHRAYDVRMSGREGCGRRRDRGSGPWVWIMAVETSLSVEEILKFGYRSRPPGRLGMAKLWARVCERVTGFGDAECQRGGPERARGRRSRARADRGSRPRRGRGSGGSRGTTIASATRGALTRCFTRRAAGSATKPAPGRQVASVLPARGPPRGGHAGPARAIPGSWSCGPCGLSRPAP